MAKVYSISYEGANRRIFFVLDETDTEEIKELEEIGQYLELRVSKIDFGLCNIKGFDYSKEKEVVKEHMRNYFDSTYIIADSIRMNKLKVLRYSIEVSNNKEFIDYVINKFFA